ncbi:hypothetical protein CWE09_03735 [Aliidiomarina minuta]|uniref:HTH cro/C1-type domain-containing protein n=1 Tax=Aliidiomarina minuta TaxID=880057 RepID=A0A432W770_9GAMM|nr:helix-turn-helix transcriptional regulator [Aliidiomarina minuta]RUO25851.1 hypothetical protein CWE09_03735 [Aliidiomarina minuta]
MNKSLNDQTGFTLKKLRSKKRISIRELALLASTEASTISRIEAGEQRPSLLLVFKICDALEISLVDFVRYLSGEEIPKIGLTPDYSPSQHVKEIPNLELKHVQFFIDIAKSLSENVKDD